MKQYLLLILLFSANIAFAEDIVIELGGNAYLTTEGQAEITEYAGIVNWSDPQEVISIFFYLDTPQSIDVELFGGSAESVIKVSNEMGACNVSFNNYLEIFSLGRFHFSKAGYQRIDIQGVSKTGDSFGTVYSLILKNPSGNVTYVHDYSNYYARRGPSVHLLYTFPSSSSIEWFYNEVTVNEENDVIGSYYMANGFEGGYFGMQTNSETEKKILFSVWSPYSTDDPNNIPEEYKVKLLRKGEGVYTGEFGNEGAGGQSYLLYKWTPGLTYKFLTRVHPDEKGNTIFTSYFYATDENRWRLIASFLRPHTSIWYEDPYSFLENFLPTQGYITRAVEFDNQWAMDTKGKWIEITKASFSYDETASAGVRLDYQGGLSSDNSRFYLKNCGFFNEYTNYGKRFTRKASGTPPQIDLDALENENNTPLCRSGLEYCSSRFWSYNNVQIPEIYSINPTSGAVKQVVTLQGINNISWKDLASDGYYLYIADTGNPYGDRTSFAIYKINIQELPFDGNVVLPSDKIEVIRFYYPEQGLYGSGVNTPFDCEAMILRNDIIHLFTKDNSSINSGYGSSEYLVPNQPHPHKEEYPAKLFKRHNNLNFLVTGADNAGVCQMLLSGQRQTETTGSYFVKIYSGFEGDDITTGVSRTEELSSFGEIETVCLGDNLFSVFLADKNFYSSENQLPLISYTIPYTPEEKVKITTGTSGSGIQGGIRFNTERNCLEGYDGLYWRPLKIKK